MLDVPVEALRRRPSNVMGTQFRSEQAAFLAGYLAALVEQRRPGPDVISSVGGKPAGMTTQQWQAELARGDALNRRYGLGPYAAAGDASAEATPPAPTVVAVASDGFDWGAAGIGAGAAIGLVLLASGMVVALRQARRPVTTTT
ncbi:MAG: hypothetical protein ACM3QU_06345 [Verrucomicrobiota bacterium]